MTVIFVLVIFGIFIGIDFIRNRNKAPQVAAVQHPQAALPGHLETVIEGFQAPERVRYHAGHGWAMRERKCLMRTGVDEFGAALLGPVERIDLPKPGHWVRQGQKAWAFYRNGEKVEMVSPVEGEVAELNEEVLKDPALLRKEPFGRGWLMAVHVPDEESVLRNLLPVQIVNNWLRENAERLFAKQAQPAGLVMADGGRPIESLADALPGADWKDLAHEFFLGK